MYNCTRRCACKGGVHLDTTLQSTDSIMMEMFVATIINQAWVFLPTILSILYLYKFNF